MNEFFVHAGWLYTKVYQNDFFFFDLWTIVHCWSGFTLFLALKSLRVKNPFPVLLTILFLYELMEILFIYFALHIFKPETIKDQFTDVFIGMVGAMIGNAILKSTSLKNSIHVKNLKIFLAFLTAITYSFLWVGFYHYRYNVELFNTPGINIGAFAFWTAGVFFTIRFYEKLKNLKLWKRLLILWGVYLTGLFIVEFFGFIVFVLHENSKMGSSPLVFGLIHGTRVLHLVYIFSPFIALSIYLSLSALVFKSLKETQNSEILEKNKLQGTKAKFSFFYSLKNGLK